MGFFKNPFSPPPKCNACMGVTETADLIATLQIAEMSEIKFGLLQYILPFVTGINRPLTFSAASTFAAQKKEKTPLIFMFNSTNKTKDLKIQSTQNYSLGWFSIGTSERSGVWRSIIHTVEHVWHGKIYGVVVENRNITLTKWRL